MPSSSTHEQRARRYLQASMKAGYTGLPAEHREAYEDQMRSHERAYARVREHALAGADKDFDKPLAPGEREHQTHLRDREGMQHADVVRVRNELRGTAQGRAARGTRPRAQPARRSAGVRAAASSAAGAASAGAGAVTAAARGGGSTFTYLIGVFLLLTLTYLLIAGKGVNAVSGIVNSIVGAFGAFVKPVDPIRQAEQAIGAGSIGATIETRSKNAPASPYAPASGTPIAGSKGTFGKDLAALTDLNTNVIDAWLNHEQGSSTVEGGDNWLNVETGGPGGGSGPYGATAKYVERLNARAAAAYTAKWIETYQPEILAARGKGTAAEVTAIEDSGFAASHYGNESPSEFLSAG